MGTRDRKTVVKEAKARRERILQHITADPPLPLNTIAEMEGMHHTVARQIITELCEEHNLTYFNKWSRRSATDTPFGLTESTFRLRANLANAHFAAREARKKTHEQSCDMAGLNAHQQKRAENRPFNVDWKLSQIERLARALGRDPREFLLQCLTT